MYLTPVCLTKIYPETPHACPRCHKANAFFFHVVWACSTLHAFWTQMTDLVTKLTQRGNVYNHKTCLLGLLFRPKTSKLTCKCIDLAILLAKRAMSLSWKAAQTLALGV